MQEKKAGLGKLWLWVPSLYFAEGTPMILVSVVAAIMYKNLGVDNKTITEYTGMLYLPWVIKPLWAPYVELLRSKRFVVLWVESLLAISIGVVALALQTPQFFALTITAFWLVGFLSATQDIAADGIYISEASPREQASMVGAQGAAWNAGRILASGLLVSLTGYLHDSMQLTWAMAWSVIMVLVALIMLSAALWHRKVLPTGDIVSHSGTAPGAMLIESLVDFFKKPKMLGMFLAVVLYRSGEGFLEKVSPLFMMDGRDVGGLGLSNQDLGHLNGTIGTLAFLISTMLGGIWVAKHGLKKTYFWFCLALNIPNFSYVFLATTLPDNFYVVATAVIVEKFGYGFGTAGYMLYMMQQVAPGRYRTSHYAFATGLMALSVMLPGYYSGAIQVALGYKNFFWFVIFATIPSFIVTWFAPFPHDEKDASSLKR